MFFSPGGLGGGGSAEGLDPALYKALMAQFPGLSQLTQPQQQPNAMQGYQWPGVQFFAGQGQGGFQNLSPFEGAKGPASESITAGLALGNYGKSSSQTPPGTTTSPFSLGALSLPSLSLPQAVAAQQGGFSSGGGENEAMVAGAGGEPAGGGMTFNAGDVLGAGEQIAGLFSSGTGSAFDPTGQMQQPAMQQQRAGERDLSTLGGSFLPPISAPGTFPNVQTAAPISSFLQPSGELQPGVTFEMQQSPTMAAPGGSAQTALGAEAPGGDLLGGGLSTLQGLYSLYGGAQSGDLSQLFGGAAGTLGGLGQMAPETMSALSQSLGLGASGLGLGAAGLGGIGGALGLYQGIEQGDPMQAIMGAAGTYAGAVPVINALLGTQIPSLTALAGELASSLGITTGATTGGAAAGAGAAGAGAAGAGAGAGAGLAGAGAAGLAAAPVMLPFIFAMINSQIGKAEANRRAQKQLQQFTRNIPSAISDIQQQAGYLNQDFSGMDEAALREAIGKMDTLANQQETTLKFLRAGGTRSMYGVGAGADYAPGPSIASGLTPTLIGGTLARLRASDALARMTGQFEPGMDAASMARALGGLQYNSSEEGSAAFNTAYNDWINQNYGLSPQATSGGYYIDTGEGGQQWVPESIDYSQRQWSPAAQAALANIRPGYAEEDLTKLFGGAQNTFGGYFNEPAYGGYQAGQSDATRQGVADAQQAFFNSLGIGTGRMAAPPMDPFTQALQQYQQQLGGLQGGLGQVTQGLQQPMTAGLDPGVVQALQQQPQSSGFAPGMNTGAGGGAIDLQALLRQMGLVA